MIIYNKGSLGLSYDFWLHTISSGSAIPRAAVSAFISVGIHLGVHYGLDLHEQEEDNILNYLGHPYVIGFLASVTCFAIIFRSNSAIARYYEAARETHTLQCKIGDACSLAVTFSQSALSQISSTAYDYKTKKDAHDEFCKKLIHGISLFTGVCYLIVRDDREFNFMLHTRGEIPPYRLRSGTDFRPHFYEDLPMWFMSTFTFYNSKPENRVRYYRHAQIPVIGILSEKELSTLEKANGPQAKAHIALHWINELITLHFLNGGFGNVSPPIISRLYQEISTSMLGFAQARRIALLPFPFIYAQLTEFLALVLVVIIPILMNSYVKSITLGTVFTFFSVLGICSMYEATRELEDPFLFEPNDLPLARWQGEFNEMLLLLYEYSAGEEVWDQGLGCYVKDN